ncbi:MAG: hypothetical protein AAFY28_18840 [Actinomycetota bacterium]
MHSIRTDSRRVVWPVGIALTLLWVAALSGQVWVFAVLFVGWALFDVAAGESHFIRRVARAEHPILFWAIVVSWIALSVLWLVSG